MKKELYTYTLIAYGLVTAVFLMIYIPFEGYRPLIIFAKTELFSLSSLYIFIMGIIVHEIIHYLCFRLANVSKNNVTIGFSLKNIMPYVHCKEKVSRKVYIFSAISPFVILAVLPLGISLYFSSPAIFAFSFFMAKGAVGDIASIMLIYKKSNKSSNIVDSKSFGFDIIR
jgi:hypothetical protein